MLPRLAVPSALALVISVTAAQAGPRAQPDRAALRQHCGGDYAAYCGDVPPDGPEVRACFRRNMTSLSPACRADIGRLGRSGTKG